MEGTARGHGPGQRDARVRIRHRRPTRISPSRSGPTTRSRRWRATSRRRRPAARLHERTDDHMSANDTPVADRGGHQRRTTKDRNPNVPLTPGGDPRRRRSRCLDAGATIIHAHNHDIRLSGEPAARAVPRRVGTAARRASRRAVVPDAVRRPRPPGQARARAARRRGRCRSRMAAVDPGSTNLGTPDTDGLPEGGVYANSYDDIRYWRSGSARSTGSARSSPSTNRASSSACSPTTAPAACPRAPW